MNTSRLLAAGLLIAAAPALAESIASLSDSDKSAICAALIASRHGFLGQPDGTHLARNPGQAWNLCFDARGFTVTPDAGGWQWGLELVQGAEGREQEADALRPAPSALRNRLSIHHNPNLEEWFVNDERGLEQGWTLWRQDDASALHAGRTCLHLRVRGGLSPDVSTQAVRFLDASGGEVLTYDGLKAWDATGRVLPVWFETAPDGFAVVTDTRAAVYPVTIDPVARQSAYLKASNTEANDFFGWSMAISGDTLVIGAQGEASAATGVNGNQNDNSATNAGAAYVFVRQGKGWKQQAYLKASNTEADDLFGTSVAISGNTIVIGASGEDSAATGVNGNQNDNSSGSSGAAYVFVRQGGIWKQQAYLKASNTGSVDVFGKSVAISGDTIVIGASGEDSAATDVNGNQNDNTASASGAAYVFARSGGVWSQIAYLKASNTAAGADFGVSVAVSGHVIVVGSPGESSGSPLSGAAYVFHRFGATVSPAAYLKASNPDSSDRFGSSVAVSGDTLVVGATGEASNATGVNGNQANNTAGNAGAAYVFKFGLSGGVPVWHQTAYLKASNTAAGNLFGLNVAISGDTIAVSAPGETSLSTGVNGSQTQGGAFGVGAAYMFTRLSGLGWVQHAYLKASNSEVGHTFGGGNGLALSGDTVVVGAIGEDSNATGVNGDQADQSATDSGAAYLFDLARSLASLAVSGQSAPGASDIFYTRAGQPALSNTRAAFSSRLNGTGAAGGANHAIYSNLGPVNQVDMLLRRRDLIGSLLDLPPNTRVSALGEPVNNKSGTPHALFLTTVTGSGLNKSSNRVLFKDDGAFLTPLLRSGRAIPALGGARASRLHEVTQLFNGNMMLPYQLSPGGGVDKTNDSGVLVLNEDGMVLVSAWREGSPASGGGVFGQFRPEASIWAGNNAFINPFIAAAGEKPRDAFYCETHRFPPVQGDAAPGLGGAVRLGKFLAASMADDMDVNNFRLRTTLTGGPKSENEAIWHGFSGGQALLRKGQVLSGSAIISRFLRFWPVQNLQGQTAVLVRLNGPGVSGKNNMALILRQNNNAVMTLLRAGDPAPGYDDPGVTIGRILRVEVNSLGSYVVLATLRGVPAGSNLALFAGGIFMGSDNAPAERLPRRVFSKGGHYTSAVTEMNRIRGILLEPAVERTGAGGRGLRQILNGSGRIACTVIGDRGRRELAVALAP